MPTRSTPTRSTPDKARQTRYIVSHQLLSQFASRRSLFVTSKPYKEQANYGTLTSGHVIACKAIRTVEAAGFKGCRC